MLASEMSKTIDRFGDKMAKAISLAFRSKEALVDEAKEKVITTCIEVFGDEMDTERLVDIGEFFADHPERIRIFLVYPKEAKKGFLKRHNLFFILY